ncbi:MAG TPA: hypothetical protein VF843_07345 [Streptosporangiaceae bacterium]
MHHQATTLQLWGAGTFGALLGWYLYYINRHRSSGVRVQDLVTVIGAIGGAAILKVFPQGSDLFGAYGIGLAAGFFLYFVVLLIMVWRSPNFSVDYFIDGRFKQPSGGDVAGQGGAGGAMDDRPGGAQPVR